MSDIKTLTFISDHGNTCLKVSLLDLTDYPKAAAAISQHSYTRDGKTYLNGDCDAGHLLSALISSGINFSFLEVQQNNTPITTKH